MNGIGIEVLLIFVLTLANGFFAASEIAIVSAKRGRLEAMADDGNPAAKTALNLTQHPDRFLATVQVGITLIGTFSAAFGGASIASVLAESLRTIPVLEPYADTLGLILVVVAITYLSLVVGELVPKRLALRRAESMALIAAPVMQVIETIARPIIWVLTVSVATIVRLFGRDDEAGNLVTTEDIVYMVREGEESGAVKADEADLIERVFEITDLPVRAVMTPRLDIKSIPVELPLDAALEAIRTTGFSRLPVYQGNPDNIIGVLNIKDLIAAVSAPHEFNLHKVMRPPVYLVESTPIKEALARFRRDGTHIGLVVGEYGEISGLVTLEDMLEELVGEIRDEHDTDADQEEAFVQREDGSWLVSGLAPYERVIERVGLPQPDEDEPRHYVTLAGMIMDRLNHIPNVGEKVTEGDYTLEVMDMDGRRVDKVLITHAPPVEDAAKNENAPSAEDAP